MAENRCRGRTVHFYNALHPEDALGGLILNPSVTEKNFLFMLEILIVASDPYGVSLRGTDTIVTPSDQPLKPGHYDIRPNSPGGTISITDEPCITRVYSGADSLTTTEFLNQVRERDRKCVITGTMNIRADMDIWVGFHAAHVFPLSHLQLFVSSGLSRCITNGERGSDSWINSCQNGLLMQSNTFCFSINPDDNYKIVSFVPDVFGVDGRKLDPICRAPDDDRSVRDELLRWHFHQAVLTNMRGAGEPGFEIDFPPGTDMVGEILNGPQAAKRMETELFLRLNRYWQTSLSH
ncbi:hypothetical protein V1523DRAFT_420090 [Lipomyces doorenjongii]